jgi:hypothetical protein
VGTVPIPTFETVTKVNKFCVGTLAKGRYTFVVEIEEVTAKSPATYRLVPKAEAVFTPKNAEDRLMTFRLLTFAEVLANTVGTVKALDKNTFPETSSVFPDVLVPIPRFDTRTKEVRFEIDVTLIFEV